MKTYVPEWVQRDYPELGNCSVPKDQGFRRILHWIWHSTLCRKRGHEVERETRQTGPNSWLTIRLYYKCNSCGYIERQTWENQ